MSNVSHTVFAALFSLTGVGIGVDVFDVEDPPEVRGKIAGQMCAHFEHWSGNQISESCVEFCSFAFMDGDSAAQCDWWYYTKMAALDTQEGEMS